MLAIDSFTGETDSDRAVALAEEADHIAPSSKTTGVLTAALLFRAAKDLRKADPAFDAFCKKYDRSVGTTYVMVAVASEPGPFREKVLQHPAVRRAAGIVAEEGRRYPEGQSSFDWALLKGTDPAAAEAAAQTVRTTPRKQVEHAISALLRPGSGAEALDTYWLMQILGKPDEGREALRKAAGLGVPLPIEP